MFDACIIGAGGIVGAAIARELAEHGLSVAGLEKHESPCQETSGLNSRVIHSGFHEIPGTLKANLAREGASLISRYAEERGIKLMKTGMLIAIPHGGIREGLWKDVDALWRLWTQSRRQGIPFQFLVSPSRVRKIAPVQALGGIFIPSVCVIDLEALASSLTEDARRAGAQLFYGSEVTSIGVDGSNYVIESSNGQFRAPIAINSAGLRAHEISRLAGGPDYKVEFLRGDYYELAGGVDRWNIRTLIYPAMPPRSASKGIHFGPHTDGRLYIGPSASPPSSPVGKEVFLQAGRRFLPGLTRDDLEWAYAGIRPKISDSGKSDFVIRVERHHPMLINLIGIDSPGLSASMAIAAYVRGLIGRQ